MRVNLKNLLVLVLLSVSLPSLALANDCVDLVTKKHLAFLNAQRIYADGVNDLNGNIEFSFESEYLFSEAGPLLAFYGPKEEVISHTKWQMMSTDERLSWIQQLAQKPEFAIQSGLVKFNPDPRFHFLPDELLIDSTGNLEIVLKHVETKYEWLERVNLINKTFGPGSMQAMVSTPAKNYFASREKALDHLGYLKFSHEFDALQKLESGFARWQKDKATHVARSFQHPFLGPMTRKKQETMELYFWTGANGSKMSADDIKFVRKNDASFKYIGSTAYRPDIAMPERVAFEVRDAHKDQEQIVERVNRLVNSFMNGSHLYFKPFAEWNAFDSQKGFAELSPELRDFLKTVFPSKADPRFEYREEELIANEVYRNFVYPLRDWRPLLRDLGAARSIIRVTHAQKNYLEKLQNIEQRFTSGAISKEQAAIEVQGALVEFVPESRILEHFRKFEKNWLESLGERRISLLKLPLAQSFLMYSA